MTMREEFERHYNFDIKPKVDELGRYLHINVQSNWMAWQAAYRAGAEAATKKNRIAEAERDKLLEMQAFDTGYRAGAEAMKESAARLVEFEYARDNQAFVRQKQIASHIRGLPVDA